jgi:hypothetical protein
MMRNKKIALLATVLAASLVVGVFAAIQLSNTLTTGFNVKAEPLLLEWKLWKPEGDLYRGSWYNTQIRLYNPTQSTFDKVIVRFTIYSYGVAFPGGSITIEYYDGAWKDMTGVLSGHGTNTLTGYFGPSTGFPVGIGYDQTTELRVMFNDGAPIAAYAFTGWAETV